MFRAALAAVAVAVSVVTVAAVRQGATFRQTANIVSVYASVTGADGHYVRGLTAADFRILDNGAPRDITVFSNAVQPITVALLVDQSGSMLARLRRVGMAATAFVDALQPADRASFDTLSHVGVPLTADRVRLRTAIRAAADWPWWDAGTPLWGGMARAMTALAGEPGRRVLVVITDGQDTPAVYGRQPPPTSAVRPVVVPLATRTGIEERTAREGFVVYAIGFADSPFDPSLQSAARQSGGGFSLIGAGDDLSRAFIDVVDDLHRQYLLGFEPAATDGTLHRITVECRVEGVTVRARESYLAEE